MKFVFLPEAENDIERLHEFLIGNGNPLAAQKAMLAIDDGIQMLLETPYVGLQMVDRSDYRQLLFLSAKVPMFCATVSMRKETCSSWCACGMDGKNAPD